ncbi:MAG: ATP-binding cassette domain-containing protein [Chlorobi bacterium]|nr:ATP-binding cassette domain-containing protein [Chlorobiota bacterium]
MQLFALIVKQDEGVQKKEIEYVRAFLLQQLDEETAGEYLALFKEFAGIGSEVAPDKKPGKASPSVRDSVRIFGICKKINKTLTQKQKVVVLVRLYELLNSEKKFTPQRMNIVNTVAEVFNISPEEYEDIEVFVRGENAKETDISNILIISGASLNLKNAIVWEPHHFTGQLIILQVKSADLYFMKHTCIEDIFLNGMPVYPGNIYLLASGSSLHLPHGFQVYYSDVISRLLGSGTIQPLIFKAEEIVFHFPNGNVGLNNVSFSEEQGKLVGIMGISGAGKTTLLNVLSGFQPPSSGSVSINGFDIYRDKEKLDGVTGYIPQDDLLIEELTVFQNLFFNARFCFKDLSHDEITGKVNDLLEELDLYHIRNLKVGSPKRTIISGGQRKRLNIALELIREPSVLFVDEPTSGLSSRDSENVMDLLRELTMKGKLIFVVIHQPSSDIFKLFDSVLILDVGGYLVYYGNPIESVIYFKKKESQINSDMGECQVCGNVNPELIFNILDARVVDEFGRYTRRRKVSPGKWARLFEEYRIKSEKKEITEIPKVMLFRPGKIVQYVIYLSRDFLSKISNKQYVLMNLLEAPVLAFILTYIIRYIADPESDIYIFRENENIPVYIFMALIVGLFLGLTISAEEIFKDRKILQRESFLNLSRGSYLMAKISVLFFISAVQATLFILIGNLVLGIKGMFFIYWLAWFTTAACANILGLIISSAFNSVITIYIVIPLLIIPMMVLSGAMFPFDKLNRKVSSVDKVPVIAEMMPTMWTYEALMVHQFKNNKFEKYFYEYEKKESQADFQKVYRIPKLCESLNRVVYLFNNDSLTVQKDAPLKILRNEILKENLLNPVIRFDAVSQLEDQTFSGGTALMISDYLDRLREYYNNELLTANRNKQKTILFMLQTNPQLFKRLRNNYYNEHLADIVQKVYERNRMLVYENRIIQKYHPIYKDPESGHWFGLRAHFYAPVKKIGHKQIDTYVYNISVVWIMILLAYVILYFDLLARVINLSERMFRSN